MHLEATFIFRDTKSSNPFQHIHILSKFEVLLLFFKVIMENSKLYQQIWIFVRYLIPSLVITHGIVLPVIHVSVVLKTSKKSPVEFSETAESIRDSFARKISFQDGPWTMSRETWSFRNDFDQTLINGWLIRYNRNF